MKQLTLLLFFYAFLGFAQKYQQEKSTIILSPKQVVQLDYPNFKGYVVKIWNKSKFDLGVSARLEENDSIQKGFGLSKGANATLAIEEEMYLQFENRFLAPLKVEYIVFKGKPEKKKTGPATPQRGFYLVNTTMQSLPLKIPGIMNPNSSPYSKSGVDLPIGQKIYLKTPGKDLLIFTVTDTIPKGARIDVADLIDHALNRKDE